jgi:hypothetical protein
LLVLEPANTVMVADLLVPYVPVIVTGVFVVTADVVIVKLREVWPAGTVTVPGTCADVLLVESVTTAPPDGAAPLNVTVAGMLVPPLTLVALGVTADSDALAFGFGKMVRKADFASPPVVALMLADAKLLDELVVTVKLLALFPPAMNTLAGTCADGWSLDNWTVVPPGGAGVTSPTVPRTESPATTEG